MLKKENKRNKYFLGILVVMLMVSSGLALFSGNSGNSRSYKGYEFTLQNNRYMTEVDGAKLWFDFLPGEVKDIPLEAYPIENRVYIITDNASSVVVPKLESVFVSKGVLPVLANLTCESNQSIIKLVKNDGESKVYIEKSCIVLEGNIYKASDRFVYWYLGIL